MLLKFDDLIINDTPEYEMTIKLDAYGDVYSMAFHDENVQMFDPCGTYEGGYNPDIKTWNGDYIVNGKRLDDLVLEILA